MKGNKVRVIHAGYDRTIPTCRVIPFSEDEVKESEDDNHDTPVDSIVPDDGDQLHDRSNDNISVDEKDPSVNEEDIDTRVNPDISSSMSESNDIRF